MASILEQIKAQVNALPPDQLKEQLARMREQKAKQQAKQVERNAKPENKEKRQAYNQKRNADPTVVAKRKAYHERPDVKARMKEYRVTRNEKLKALVARAKELGLLDEPQGEATA